MSKKKIQRRWDRGGRRQARERQSADDWDASALNRSSKPTRGKVAGGEQHGLRTGQGVEGWVGDSVHLPIELSNAVGLAHERVLAPYIGFRMVVVRPVVLDWCERAIAVRRWHDRFREDTMRLGAEVTEVSVSVVVGRTDGADEGVVTIPNSMLVFLLARRAPDRIENVLVFRRGLWSKVRPNRAAMRPHYWLVVLRAPLGRGR